MTIFYVYREGCDYEEGDTFIGIYDEPELAKMAAEATGGTVLKHLLNNPPEGYEYRHATHQCIIHKPFGEIEIQSSGPSFSSHKEGDLWSSQKKITTVSFISPEVAKATAIAYFDAWKAKKIAAVEKRIDKLRAKTGLSPNLPLGQKSTTMNSPE